MKGRTYRILVGANGKEVRTNARTSDEMISDAIQFGLIFPLRWKQANFERKMWHYQEG